MKAVIQRVSGCSVTVEGQLAGAIDKGFLILLGIEKDDNENDAKKLSSKISVLRVFTDENDKMNLGLEAVAGEVLVVSQFTLYGSCKKGRRPDFFGAADPEKAESLYEHFLFCCAEEGYTPQHGIFGADMKVSSVNDGPVTLIVDTADL